jgi:hypothetical protein
LTNWSEKAKGVVIMLVKKIQRLAAALVLVGFVGSTVLTISAEASPQHPQNRQEEIRRWHNYEMIKHRKEVERRHQIAERRAYNRRLIIQRHDTESHSDTGNLVTGLIIGGIIGAVVANNS